MCACELCRSVLPSALPSSVGQRPSTVAAGPADLARRTRPEAQVATVCTALIKYFYKCGRLIIDSICQETYASV